jgi:hypothetical protein
VDGRTPRAHVNVSVGSTIESGRSGSVSARCGPLGKCVNPIPGLKDYWLAGLESTSSLTRRAQEGNRRLR